MRNAKQGNDLKWKNGLPPPRLCTNPLPVNHPRWRHQKPNLLSRVPLQNSACTAGYSFDNKVLFHSRPCSLLRIISCFSLLTLRWSNTVTATVQYYLQWKLPLFCNKQSEVSLWKYNYEGSSNIWLTFVPLSTNQFFLHTGVWTIWKPIVFVLVGFPSPILHSPRGRAARF